MKNKTNLPGFNGESLISKSLKSYATINLQLAKDVSVIEPAAQIFWHNCNIGSWGQCLFHCFPRTIGGTILGWDCYCFACSPFPIYF